MFRVTADSLAAYLDFDAQRKPDRVRLHALIRETAPALKCDTSIGERPQARRACA
jgi:hypothetical protein